MKLRSTNLPHRRHHQAEVTLVAGLQQQNAALREEVNQLRAAVLVYQEVVRQLSTARRSAS
jgi:hypothetical protein